MQLSRFWSTFWTGAGFLFLVGLVQYLVDGALGLLALIPLVGVLVSMLMAVVQTALPILTALTYGNWKWGWKGDNAGLRRTPEALFWYLPGLLGGAVVAAVAHLLAPVLRDATALPGAPFVALVGPLGVGGAVVLLLLHTFSTELIFRGMLVSRLQYDLSGRNLLVLALGMPFVWALFQNLIRLIYAVPSPMIYGLGTGALSIFLALLFLRTDSVWLAAGVRAGIWVMPLLLDWRFSETALLLIFGPLAGLLLALEVNKQAGPGRPGPRRGPQRVTGRTVRGPWGPH